MRELDAGAHVGGEVLDATEVDEGSGQEATQADVEDQAALDNLDNLALDILAGVELLLDAVPSTLVLGTLLGQDQTTVLVLLLENQSLDGITECNDVCRVSVLADGQLADRDNALGLESDVNEHLVMLDLNDSAVNEIALIKVGNRTVDEVVHLLLVDIVKRENGRVLNLTQRWTLSNYGAPIARTYRRVRTSTQRLRNTRGATDTNVTLMQSRSYRLRGNEFDFKRELRFFYSCGDFFRNLMNTRLRN